MDPLALIRNIKNSESNIRKVINDPQYWTHMILDCSVLADSGLIEMDEAMLPMGYSDIFIHT